MLLNYIKTAFRNLSKNKSFSIINILGFSFSISVCLMILLFVMKEKSYDSYPNADRIYRLVDTENNTSGIDYRAAQIALANFRQIEKACLINVNPREYPITYNNNGYLIKGVMSTDSAFFKMFSIQFIEGDSKNPLKDPMTCILTESAARKIFGKENPIGKSIIYKEKNALFITGVIKDFPENSSIQANIFVSSEKFQMNQWCNGSECKYLYNIYFQLKKNTDAELFARKLNERAELFAEYAKRMGLMPLRDIYLYDSTFEGYTEKGNPDRLKLLINIAIIILTLSIINYVNLTAAQQNKRNKETGIRKTVGASRKDMVSLFLTESVLVAFISFGIALAFLELFLPHFGGIVDMNISSAPLFSYPIIIMLPLAIFIIGALTGIGPAIIYASFNPAHIFSGGFTKNGKKSYMRNALTVFQFSVSICLIFCIIVIQKQISYVKHKDLGFEKEQTLYLDMPMFNDSLGIKTEILANELRKYPNILSMTGTQGTPGEIWTNCWAGITGYDKPIPVMFADSSFLKTFGISIVKGRDFIPGDINKACIFNEAAYKQFGWKDLEGKRFNNLAYGGLEVVGITKNFNFSSLHDPISPVCIAFMDMGAAGFTLRIAKGRLDETMKFIENKWQELIPFYPMQYQFFDERFDSMYRKEEKFGELIGLFSMLAIVISCMGILGLAVFSAERRAKEIGIRKVHGASIPELMYMLNKDFIKWVLIAFVIAAPVGYYFMQNWLEDFAYKASIDWLVFFLSGFFALAVALFTINWQIWRSATRNPVEVLKYE